MRLQCNGWRQHAGEAGEKCSAHRLPIATGHPLSTDEGVATKTQRLLFYDVDRFLSACHSKVKAVTVGGVKGGN